MRRMKVRKARAIALSLLAALSVAGLSLMLARPVTQPLRHHE